MSQTLGPLQDHQTSNIFTHLSPILSVLLIGFSLVTMCSPTAFIKKPVAHQM